MVTTEAIIHTIERLSTAEKIAEVKVKLPDGSYYRWIYNGNDSFNQYIGVP